MNRSIPLLLGVAMLLLLFIATSLASPTTAAPLRFEMEALPLTLSQPIGTVTTILPFTDNTLLVGTQTGQIYQLTPPPTPNGIWQVSLYLSLVDRITYYSEAGFYDIEPAPDFPTTPHLYLSYVNLDKELVVDRFNTETQNHTFVITVPPPTIPNPYYHHGGDIEFYDGLLYLSVGDRRLSYPYEPGHPSQRLDSVLGKILRIDVTTGNPLTYTIPADNPYVNQPNVRSEIWALGFRNPWKMTFDDTTGDLWIADVGNVDWEEVNYLPAGESATNFGWRCFEGNDRIPYQDPICKGIVHTPPLHEYLHGTFEGRYQCAITGGIVYRNPQNPNLEGMYLYADYCANRLWGLKQVGEDWVNYHLLELPDDLFPTAFASDEIGNIFVGGEGAIYRLVDNAPPGATPIPTATPAHNLFLPLSHRNDSS